jgi:hypothetical protein
MSIKDIVKANPGRVFIAKPDMGVSRKEEAKEESGQTIQQKKSKGFRM